MHVVFFSVLLLQSFFALSVQATLYVTQPTAGSTCSGGKPCTVQWLDDGTAPLLSQIGPCYVALYNGDNVLVQQIQPVDISSVHSLEFTCLGGERNVFAGNKHVQISRFANWSSHNSHLAYGTLNSSNFAP